MGPKSNQNGVGNWVGVGWLAPSPVRTGRAPHYYAYAGDHHANSIHGRDAERFRAGGRVLTTPTPLFRARTWAGAPTVHHTFQRRSLGPVPGPGPEQGCGGCQHHTPGTKPLRVPTMDIICMVASSIYTIMRGPASSHWAGWRASPPQPRSQGHFGYFLVPNWSQLGTLLGPKT